MTDGQMIVSLVSRIAELRIAYERDENIDTTNRLMAIEAELALMIDNILDGKVDAPDPIDM